MLVILSQHICFDIDKQMEIRQSREYSSSFNFKFLDQMALYGKGTKTQAAYVQPHRCFYPRTRLTLVNMTQ